jgi:cobalt-zinc-cadmium efflux system outer membrane protein
MRVRCIQITMLCCLFGLVPICAQTAYSLQKALQTARVNNPTLKAGSYDIPVAEADIVTAKLRPNPTLNNQSLQLMQPAYYAPGTEWQNGKNRQVWWQLTKSFQLPSQRRYKIDAATQGATLAQKEYDETERQVFLDVAGKWLDTWAAQKQLDLLQAAKNNIDSLVTINKLRLKNQVITQTDLSRTELLSRQYALQIVSAGQQYSNETAALKFMLGIGETPGIDTSDHFVFGFPSGLDTMLQQALNTRSDMIAFPTPELGVIYNPQNTIHYLGFYGTIQIPLFSRNQGEIKKSNVLKKQAEQELISTQVQVQTELSSAYHTYQVQKQNLQNFDQLLLQSASILNTVKYSYLHGGTTIIDFLEAQRSWLETQQQYYETMRQYRQSYIKLLYASGIINQIAQ